MKSRFAYGKLKTIFDFKSSIYYRPLEINRSQVRIAVIDNDGFDRDSFAKTGFTNVTPIKSYDGPETFSSFDIILCDIDGVGKAINPKAQGVAVAKTLKEIYPLKTVLLYSGKNPNDFSENHQTSCDGFIPKDHSMSELASDILSYCKYLSDPAAAWERHADYFVKKGLSYKSIAWLEDAYVESLCNKQEKVSTSFAEKLGIAAKYVALVIDLVALFIH